MLRLNLGDVLHIHRRGYNAHGLFPASARTWNLRLGLAGCGHNQVRTRDRYRYVSRRQAHTRDQNRRHDHARTPGRTHRRNKVLVHRRFRGAVARHRYVRRVGLPALGYQVTTPTRLRFCHSFSRISGSGASSFPWAYSRWRTPSAGDSMGHSSP